MGSIFDIVPPQPKKSQKTAPKRSGAGGYFLLLVIIAMVVIFTINSYPEKFSLPQTPTTSQTKNTVDFDLFNNETLTNPSPTGEIKIRIINASGKIQATSKIQSILSEAGLAIEQTTVTETNYNQDFQVVIYHKPDQKAKAQQAEDALNTTYTTKIEESLSLGDTYDILIIINQNQV